MSEKDPHYKVRIALPGDAEALRRVTYKTWLVTYPNDEHGVTVEDIEQYFKDKLSPEGIQRTKDHLSCGSKDQRVWVAVFEGEVVAVCGAMKNEIENKLSMIYVLPEHQGQGVGSLLWQKACSFFEPHNGVVVEVASYNKKAISFYRTLGFMETSEPVTLERFTFASGTTLPEIRMRRSGV